jgi:hypothetical protein
MRLVVGEPVATRPKRAVGADLAVRVVRIFFMGTTHDPVSHGDRLHPLRFDERKDLLADARVCAPVGVVGLPAFQR